MQIKKVIDIDSYKKSFILNERYNLLEKENYEAFDVEAFHTWRERKNIVYADTFDKMLEVMGYNKNIFSRAVNVDSLLDFDEEKVNNVLNTHSWYKVFQESLNMLKYHNTEYDNSKGMEYIIRPFSLYIKKEISSHIENHHDLFNGEIINDVLNAFNYNAINIALKTIILELNVSRVRGELQGNTAEERYHSFNNLFSEEQKLLDFYSEYIVLARILSTKADFTIKNTVEFLDRIKINKNKIYKDFNLPEKDIINSVSLGLGDSHNEGNTVISVTFNSGKKLIYKPRNSEVAIVYHDLINWLNEKETILSMETYKVLNFEDFSIEEFVPQIECSNLAEVKDFYTRFGQILSVMYILNGTDMHMENVIAKGTCPVIVDFETILHSHVPLIGVDNAHYKANLEQIKFVSSTLLLPSQIKFNPLQDVGIDLSALNGQEKALPYKVQGIINNNTDTMMVGMIESSMSGSNNLPMLNNEVVPFNDYVEDIIRGFKSTCNVILEYKNELLSNNSILEKFKDLKVRIIAKGTSQYANIISNTYHPDYLRDAIDRDKVMENIWAFPYKIKEIIKSEYRDMLNDDIPIFFNYTNSTDLIDSKGNKIKEVFEDTAYDRLLDKIEKLNEKEIEKQISIIKIQTNKTEENIVNPNNSLRLNDYLKHNKDLLNPSEISEELIKEAIKIEKQIRELAIQSDDKQSVTWLDILEENNSYKISDLPSDLYNGLSGVFIFYYNLYKVTGNKEYKEFANKVLNAAEDVVLYKTSYSAFVGKLSLLYPYSILFLEERDTQAEKKLGNLLEEIGENIDSIENFDWVGGITGITHIVLNLFEQTNNMDYLTNSILLGNKLVQKLNNLEEKLVGGFSHGASSIAFVLLRLGNLSNVKKFTNHGLEILAYDRSLYSDEHGGWLDKSNNDSSFVRYDWCHGSVGIGLSRLLLKKYYTDEMIQEEINRAIQITSDSLFRNNDCICHGNLGVTELFVTAYLDFEENEFLEYARNLALGITIEAEKHGQYLISGLNQFPKIGLFTGLAGVGNQLLRVASPNAIKSILSLE